MGEEGVNKLVIRRMVEKIMWGTSQTESTISILIYMANIIYIFVFTDRAIKVVG